MHWPYLFSYQLRPDPEHASADVVRYHTGPALGAIAQILVALNLAGIGIAQARVVCTCKHLHACIALLLGRFVAPDSFHLLEVTFLNQRITHHQKPLTAFPVQVIACAGDAFNIDRRFSKREYELIFGDILMIFAFVPVRLAPALPEHVALTPLTEQVRRVPVKWNT